MKDDDERFSSSDQNFSDFNTGQRVASLSEEHSTRFLVIDKPELNLTSKEDHKWFGIEMDSEDRNKENSHHISPSNSDKIF